MTKQTWIFASVLSVLVIIGYIGLSARQQTLRLNEALDKLQSVEAASKQSQSQAEQLKLQVDEAKEQIDQLKQEKEQAAKVQSDLEHQMRSQLESKDITISELQGKLTVNILDRILFDSGEAVLKPEGEEVLHKIAKILEQFPNRQIHVIGHTDNIPIRSSARSRFASNWELSTARATAAVRFLQEKANVDPRRLGAVGYGEFHPIAENNTVEGRAKNRRIALVVLPEVMNDTELTPTQTTKKDAHAAPALAQAQTSAQTNAPATAKGESSLKEEPDNREE